MQAEIRKWENGDVAGVASQLKTDLWISQAKLEAAERWKQVLENDLVRLREQVKRLAMDLKVCAKVTKKLEASVGMRMMELAMRRSARIWMIEWVSGIMSLLTFHYAGGGRGVFGWMIV